MLDINLDTISEIELFDLISSNQITFEQFEEYLSIIRDRTIEKYLLIDSL